MIKKLVLVLVALIGIVAGSYFYVVKQMDQYLAQPLMIQEAQLVTIASGTTLSRELAQLTEQAWIQDSFVAEWVRRFHPELSKIKAGTYKLQPDMSLEQALALLVSGKEHQFSITSWRAVVSRVAGYPRKQRNITQQLTGLTEIDIAKALGIEHEKLEGLFLAETYHFTKGTSDVEILKRANQKLEKFLQVTWEHRQEGLPIQTPYEALILASIIEKETSIAEERERIAAVFINRLNKRMRLQTDPTVIYGMGETYDGNIRKKDLRARTPYNTYVINGLPPTPIAMPGEASIYAALNPEQSDYLYFVASGEGGHNFSKTLADHNRAVRAYLKNLEQNNERKIYRN